ncbi:MAG TPA: NAD(P)H-hydrate dehydratase, partial [Abditibacterium sp.]
MKVFTAQQMRDFDRVATEEYGIPSIVLMENAALRVVEFLEAKFSPLSEKKIVILCGKGNNGGDGLAIARHLAGVAFRVDVLLTADKTELRGDALINYEALGQLGGMRAAGRAPKTMPDWVYEMPLDDMEKMKDSVGNIWTHLQDADVTVDALLGTGFQGELHDERLKQGIRFTYITGDKNSRVAVDLPSAFNSDTGEATKKYSAQADYLVTFVGPKRGQFLRESLEQCGEVWVGEVGTTLSQLKGDEYGVDAGTDTGVETLDLETAQRLIPKRSIDAHKGDAGRALIIGGSLGMSGAVALASRAALNAGCGLCIAAMPEKILPTFAASILEATSHPLPCDPSGKLLESAADELPPLWKGVQVVALGPGISRSEEAQKFVARVVRECPIPLVIDADALHALPAMAAEVKNRAADTILTPHPGEMGVLMGISAGEVNDSRFEIAEACAKKYGAIVVLKGARSLVATPDGRIFVNLTGNPGMATGGSGDVLTGTIAGLLAQLKNPEDATKLGVYLHGFAGDLAFEAKGNGLVAGDIAAHLGQALVEIPKREVERING